MNNNMQLVNAINDYADVFERNAVSQASTTEITMGLTYFAIGAAYIRGIAKRLETALDEGKSADDFIHDLHIQQDDFTARAKAEAQRIRPDEESMEMWMDCANYIYCTLHYIENHIKL